MAATTIKDGFQGGSDNQLKVNPDGSINVNGGGGSSGNVNIHDSAGNNLTSTGGALNVNTTGSATVTGTVTSVTEGLHSFETGQYTIGLTSSQLTPTPLVGRSSISIRVDKSNTGAIYIGPTNSVTTTTGYPLFAGDTLAMDLTDSNQIWAVADTANQVLAVLEIA